MGKTIRIFLVDGNPNGILTAEIINWTGSVISAPRTKLSQLAKRDEYDRLLRYVYIDGVFVNAELVAQGFATAYIFDTDEWYSQILVQLEQYAKMRERGLWAK